MTEPRRGARRGRPSRNPHPNDINNHGNEICGEEVATPSGGAVRTRGRRRRGAAAAVNRSRSRQNTRLAVAEAVAEEVRVGDDQGVGVERNTVSLRANEARLRVSGGFGEGVGEEVGEKDKDEFDS